MKNLEEIKNIIQHKKPVLIKKHKIKDIGIFGSYVRGEQRLNSDIDILISFEEFPGLIEFVGIENELSEYLGTKVDLVTKTGLKQGIGKHILKEVVYL
ncbi:Nucleotidyltransferase domain-containing protein [Desulfonema limicola]|uniref:Nucleotidyltransferase domain-containing protein n=1 Tax=Desulfonema limicola TaxID=45656 RepID=A0A975B7T2_9BACT|nr:nucleotidyltransferase family protein [Desulfonema limicola]QTA80467.1 Nucleotidyltransferase domain-containing protein [Desulfonema limicola]